MRRRAGSAATRVPTEERGAVPGLVAEEVGKGAPSGGLNDGD